MLRYSIIKQHHPSKFDMDTDIVITNERCFLYDQASVKKSVKRFVFMEWKEESNTDSVHQGDASVD